MTHQRVRKFNTKDTYPEQKLDNDLCQVVVAKGTMVFVRGQIGQDLETSKSVGIGDVTAQADQAMKNIKMLLEEAGSSLQHICKITIYIIDPRYREAVYRVVGRAPQGRISGLDRPRRLGAGEAGMGGGDRSDSRHSGLRRSMTFSIAARCRANRHVRHRRLFFFACRGRALRLCARAGWRGRKPEHHRPHAWTEASRPHRARRDRVRGDADHRGIGRPYRLPPARCRRRARTYGRVLRSEDAWHLCRRRRRRRGCGRQHAQDEIGAGAHGFRVLGASGALGGRLLAAMRAGLDAGGEEGPVHSAGLLLVRDVPWPVANLRIDWSEADPIADLDALVGDIRAAARGLCRARARSDGGSELRRPGG